MMRRGSLVTVALPGDLGKPRPALVLMDDDLIAVSTRLIVVPLTSTIQDAPLVRVTVNPSPANGLKAASQIMVDRITSVPREKVGPTIGQLETALLEDVIRLIAMVLGTS